MLKCHVLLAVVFTSVGFAVASLVMSGGRLTVNADCRDECPREPGTACGNGDVNADGKRDISDAVYLLSHLFLGGPEPAPIPCDLCDSCCPHGSGCAGCLPATGQTFCYDNAGNVIDCNDETYPGQDGFTRIGCPVEGRFVDNGDGTVMDNCTGLTWQQATADVNEDGFIDTNDALTWAEALRYCDDLEHAEQSDWRLPNAKELMSLADYGRCGPAIDPVFALALPGAGWTVWYWTSTSPVNPVLRGQAVNVYFWDGVLWGDPKTSRGYVLAVRG